MNRKAFTLVELLIVVVIIAVLAAIALPGLVKTLEKEKQGEAIANLEFIRSAQRQYFLANDTFSSDINSLYIQENPNDAANRYFDYTIVGASSANFTARAERRDNAPSPYNEYYYEINKEGTYTSNDPSF